MGKVDVFLSSFHMSEQKHTFHEVYFHINVDFRFEAVSWTLVKYFFKSLMGESTATKSTCWAARNGVHSMIEIGQIKGTIKIRKECNSIINLTLWPKEYLLSITSLLKQIPGTARCLQNRQKNDKYLLLVLQLTRTINQVIEQYLFNELVVKRGAFCCKNMDNYHSIKNV